MQRQSLGSPSSSSKMVRDEALLQLPSSPSLLSTPAALSGSCFFHGDKEEELEKKKKKKSVPAQTAYTHIIPLLTFLCFFILYLSSHHPSQFDLAHFNAFKVSTSSDSEDNILQDIKKGDILSIRSLKNSDQAAAVKLRRRHRKMIRV